MALLQKKVTIFVVTFFDGFVTKKCDDNCRSIFWWFSYEEGDNSNVVTFFYSGGVAKKVMAANCRRFFSFFFLWSFWFSSLELTINNEMLVFFNVEGYNG
jgi:hypothetical protein